MDEFEYDYRKKKKLKKEPIYILCCLLCLVIGCVGGYFYRGKNIIPLKHTGDVFDELGQKIESDFLDTTDLQNDIKERMLYGMVAALGDPHSAYLTSKQANDFTTSINGSIQGIGVTYMSVDAGALVLDVYDHTPASDAGLLAGDIITHVQGTSIAGYSSSKIKDSIKGENGTPVALKILRNGKEQETSAIRGSVETSVNYEIRKDNHQNIGYLRLTTFGEGTHILVEEALQHFKKENVENIVVDLRGNGGGYLDAVCKILDLLIPKDEVVIRVQDKNGKEEVRKAKDCQKYSFDKGFILVDQGTASASEVMSSALKEHLHYTLVGEKTYGKGTVQTQYTMSDGSVLKYTYAKWLTPNEKCVNGEGIEPDVKVTSQKISSFHVFEFEKNSEFDQVSSSIQSMQEMLKELGYQVDRTDGYFSLKTRNALEAFERRYGLSVNGIFEKNDETILLNVLAYHLYQENDDVVYLKTVELMK